MSETRNRLSSARGTASLAKGCQSAPSRPPGSIPGTADQGSSLSDPSGGTSTNQVKLHDEARVQRDLGEVLTLIVDDVRRAGYAGLSPNTDNDQDGTIDADDLLYNPFAAGGNDVIVDEKSGEAANGCVTF